MELNFEVIVKEGVLFQMMQETFFYLTSLRFWEIIFETRGAKTIHKIYTRMISNSNNARKLGDWIAFWSNSEKKGALSDVIFRY